MTHTTNTSSTFRYNIDKTEVIGFKQVRVDEVGSIFLPGMGGKVTGTDADFHHYTYKVVIHDTHWLVFELLQGRGIFNRAHQLHTHFGAVRGSSGPTSVSTLATGRVRCL